MMTEEEREVWEDDMRRDGEMDAEPARSCETCVYCAAFASLAPSMKSRYCCTWSVVVDDLNEVEEVDLQDGCQEWEWRQER